MNSKKIVLLGLVLLAVAGCSDMDRKHLKPRVSTTDAVPISDDGTIEIRQGDTVYAISRRYKVPISAIVAENNLARPYVLQPGLRLKIPAMAEYTVQPGDTADTIAMARGISPTELIATNKTASVTSVETADLAPLDLKPGDVVRVPEQVVNVTPSAPPPSNPNAITTIDAPPGTPTPIVDNSLQPLGVQGVDRVGETQYKLTPLGPTTTPENVPPPVAATAAQATSPATAPTDPAMAGIFDWPVEGRVLKNFGKQAAGDNSDGINIAAPRGTPVTAAAGGTVIHAGTMAGLGNLVLIRHENNLVTAYGHLDRVLVDRDSIVAQGDVLGTVGNSGGVKVPQLHFQVRQGETPVDPAGYLPKR